MLTNQWPDRVSDRTVSLLNRWAERRTCTMRGAVVPKETSRSVFVRIRDKVTGKIIITVKTLTGLDFIHSTRPKCNWDDVDEFGNTFLSLPEMDQTVILAGVDPEGEFITSAAWAGFLRSARIHKQRIYDEMLRLAMFKLQQLLEGKDMVERKGIQNERELHGWKEIADYLGRSVPTVVKLAKYHRLPVGLMAGTPYSTAERLDEWKEKGLEALPLAEKQRK